MPAAFALRAIHRCGGFGVGARLGQLRFQGLPRGFGVGTGLGKVCLELVAGLGVFGLQARQFGLEL